MTIPLLLNGFLRPTVAFNFLSALPSNLTFTRAAVTNGASYFGPDGIMRYAGTNAARFDFDPVTLAPKGLLMEEQRTNLLELSTPVEGSSGWGGPNTTSTANQAVAPDGTTTMTLLTSNNAVRDACRINNITAITSGQTYTLSAFLKAGTNNGFISLSNGGLTVHAYAKLTLSGNGTISVTGSGATGTITNVGNGIYRATLTKAIADTIVYSDIGIWDGGADAFGYPGCEPSKTCYVWGAQLENATYATSLIPTTSAAVIRAVDLLSTTSIPFYNNQQGTLFVEHIINTVGAYMQLAQFDDTTNNERISLANPIGGGGVRLDIASANVLSVNTLSTGPATAGIITKSAASYANKASIGQVAMTGGLYTSGNGSGTGTYIAPVVTKLYIGNRSLSAPYTGHIRRFAYWNRELSASEIRRITQ